MTTRSHDKTAGATNGNSQPTPLFEAGDAPPNRPEASHCLIYTYIPGDCAEDTLPSMSKEAQYQVGIQAAAAVVIVPLLLAVTKLVLTHVQQSELNVREKLLELELKLSEMNEALPRQDG